MPYQMTERDLAQQVRELAHLYGVHAVHIPDGRQVIGGAGLPDWLLIGRHRIAWRELKSAHGVLTGDQARWRDMLQGAEQNWSIWRPLDLHSGTIDHELQVLAQGLALPRG